MTIHFEEQLSRMLVFGATGHLGEPLARWTMSQHPEIALRLATSRPESEAALRRDFPNTEVAVCSYYQPGELRKAMDGVDGVFVVTPDFTDELTAMGNLIHAVEEASSVRHIVRLIGDPPGVTMRDVPANLRMLGEGTGAAVGHQAARELLDRGAIPVTYLNVLGYYTDDLCRHWYGNGIREHDVLSEPRRHHMFYVDPAEVGEAAARVMTRRDPTDIGATYQLHNAVEGLAVWRRFCGPAVKHKYGDDAEDYFVEYFSWEADMVFTLIERDIGGPAGKAARWVFQKGPRRLQNVLIQRMVQAGRKPISNDLEHILGRRPRSLREWVRDHRQSLAPA
jgi:NmrA-like family